MTEVESRLLGRRPVRSRQWQGFAAPLRLNVESNNEDDELRVELVSSGITTVEVPASGIALGNRLTQAVLGARVPGIVATTRRMRR